MPEISRLQTMSVDVVVPCHNYGRYLAVCADSVLSQPGLDVRVLIIDDCSTDDSEFVGRSLASADPRIEYRRHTTNRGHITTYNEGIEWLKQESCLFLSADDLFMPNALTEAVSLLAAEPSVVLCHGQQVVFGEGTPDVPAVRDALPRVAPGRDLWVEMCATGQNTVATPTVVSRSRVVKQTGGFSASLPHTADMEMWLRIAACGDVARFPIALAGKRIHGKNMQLRYLSRALADLEERQKAFHAAFIAARDQVTDLPSLRRSADRALALEAVTVAARAFEAADPALTKSGLDLARALDRSIEQTSEWRSLAIKRRLGRRWSARVAALRRWVAGKGR